MTSLSSTKLSMFMGIFVLLALSNFLSFSHSPVSRSRCRGLAKLSILYFVYTKRDDSSTQAGHLSHLKLCCKMIHKAFIKIPPTHAQLKTFCKNLLWKQHIHEYVHTWIHQYLNSTLIHQHIISIHYNTPISIINTLILIHQHTYTIQQHINTLIHIQYL